MGEEHHVGVHLEAEELAAQEEGEEETEGKEGVGDLCTFQ